MFLVQLAMSLFNLSPARHQFEEFVTIRILRHIYWNIIPPAGSFTNLRLLQFREPLTNRLPDGLALNNLYTI